MFALVRFLFFGALALILLIPAGIVLAAIGLPVIAVLGVLALPLLIVLFLVGLPILIVGAVLLGVLGAVFGTVVAFLSLGAVVLKVAFIVLVPLFILSWLLRGRRESIR
jgi:hypothetical protein